MKENTVLIFLMYYHNMIECKFMSLFLPDYITYLYTGHWIPIIFPSLIPRRRDCSVQEYALCIDKSALSIPFTLKLRWNDNSTRPEGEGAGPTSKVHSEAQGWLATSQLLAATKLFEFLNIKTIGPILDLTADSNLKPLDLHLFILATDQWGSSYRK